MAVLEQERHVEVVSGAAERFVITSRMVSATTPDQLPHLNIFVLTVVDPSDAAEDAFARVARVSDLSLLPIGRDNALSTTGEYLANSVTLSYSTLNDGLLAATALKDRVNKLIQDWISFATDFSSPDPTPTLYTLPTTDPSQKEAYIAAYKAAKQDRYQKSLDKAAADATQAAAQADLTYKKSLVSDIEATVEATAINATAFGNAAAAYGVLNSAGVTFLAAASCASSGDQTIFQTALTAASVEEDVLTSNVADAASIASQAFAYQSARTTEVGMATVALNAATVDQAVKAQQLTAAIAAESLALTAVLAICPDFDSSSIPLVDG